MAVFFRHRIFENFMIFIQDSLKILPALVKIGYTIRRDVVMMRKLKERLQQFMYGRYGMDGLGNFLLWTAIVLLILSIFVPTGILYYVSLALMVYTYFRVFSRNVQKRYQENCVYYRYVNKIKGFFAKQNSYRKQRKTHHIYSCPNCKQKIRIPKGKGKVMIRCSRCGTEFMKNSR